MQQNVENGFNYKETNPEDLNESQNLENPKVSKDLQNLNGDDQVELIDVIQSDNQMKELKTEELQIELEINDLSLPKMNGEHQKSVENGVDPLKNPEDAHKEDTSQNETNHLGENSDQVNGLELASPDQRGDDHPLGNVEIQEKDSNLNFESIDGKISNSDDVKSEETRQSGIEEGDDSGESQLSSLEENLTLEMDVSHDSNKIQEEETKDDIVVETLVEDFIEKSVDLVSDKLLEVVDEEHNKSGNETGNQMDSNDEPPKEESIVIKNSQLNDAEMEREISLEIESNNIASSEVEVVPESETMEEDVKSNLAEESISPILTSSGVLEEEGDAHPSLEVEINKGESFDVEVSPESENFKTETMEEAPSGVHKEDDVIDSHQSVASSSEVEKPGQVIEEGEMESSLEEANVQPASELPIDPQTSGEAVEEKLAENIVLSTEHLSGEDVQEKDSNELDLALEVPPLTEESSTEDDPNQKQEVDSKEEESVVESNIEDDPIQELYVESPSSTLTSLNNQKEELDEDDAGEVHQSVDDVTLSSDMEKMIDDVQEINPMEVNIEPASDLPLNDDLNEVTGQDLKEDIHSTGQSSTSQNSGDATIDVSDGPINVGNELDEPSQEPLEESIEAVPPLEAENNIENDGNHEQSFEKNVEGDSKDELPMENKIEDDANPEQNENSKTGTEDLKIFNEFNSAPIILEDIKNVILDPISQGESNPDAIPDDSMKIDEIVEPDSVKLTDPTSPEEVDSIQEAKDSESSENFSPNGDLSKEVDPEIGNSEVVIKNEEEAEGTDRSSELETTSSGLTPKVQLESIAKQDGVQEGIVSSDWVNIPDEQLSAGVTSGDDVDLVGDCNDSKSDLKNQGKIEEVNDEDETLNEVSQENLVQKENLEVEISQEVILDVKPEDVEMEVVTQSGGQEQASLGDSQHAPDSLEDESPNASVESDQLLVNQIVETLAMSCPEDTSKTTEEEADCPDDLSKTKEEDGTCLPDSLESPLYETGQTLNDLEAVGQDLENINPQEVVADEDSLELQMASTSHSAKMTEEVNESSSKDSFPVDSNKEEIFPEVVVSNFVALNTALEASKYEASKIEKANLVKDVQNVSDACEVQVNHDVLAKADVNSCEELEKSKEESLSHVEPLSLEGEQRKTEVPHKVPDTSTLTQDHIQHVLEAVDSSLEKLLKGLNNDEDEIVKVETLIKQEEGNSSLENPTDSTHKTNFEECHRMEVPDDSPAQTSNELAPEISETEECLSSIIELKEDSQIPDTTSEMTKSDVLENGKLDIASDEICLMISPPTSTNEIEQSSSNQEENLESSLYATVSKKEPNILAAASGSEPTAIALDQALNKAIGIP